MATEDEMTSAEELGEELAAALDAMAWPSWNVVRRCELVAEACDAARPRLGVTGPIRLAFVVDIDGHRAGGGFDDETGTYVLIVLDEVAAASEPAPLVSAIAHELRHAYQHDVLAGRVADARRAEWAAAKAAYTTTEAIPYKFNPLEADAETSPSRSDAASPARPKIGA